MNDEKIKSFFLKAIVGMASSVLKYPLCEVTTMESCPFCAVVKKQLPAEMIYEDEYCVAFKDIRPQAPIHVLVVPKEHVACADDVSDPLLWGRLMGAVKTVASQLGVARAYRIVVNCGESAGQTVPHLHIHLLAGRGLQWPPG